MLISFCGDDVTSLFEDQSFSMLLSSKPSNVTHSDRYHLHVVLYPGKEERRLIEAGQGGAGRRRTGHKKAGRGVARHSKAGKGTTQSRA